MRRHLAWSIPAVLAGVTAPFLRGDDGDGRGFAAAGRVLLSSHWHEAYEQAGTMVGPLQLALYGSVGRSTAALSVVLAVATALLVVAAARAAGVEEPALLAAAGLAAVFTGITRGVYEAGHPANALVPLLWVVAAAEARRGRSVRAGLIVGLCTGIETWGILGLAVLVLAPRAAAVAAAGAAALFLPFLIGGRFAGASYVWPVDAHTLLGHVVAPGTPFTWPLRFAQGGAAILVGSGLMLRLRRNAHAVWLVPLVAVLVRLLLDPADRDYYFLAVATPALVGGVLLASRASRFSLTRGQSSSITAYHAESRL